MIRSRWSSRLAALLIMTVAACGDRSAETSTADTLPEAASSGTDPAPAATDSVITWAEEIRRGIEPLAGQVGADPAAARQRAVELYITRQEQIERTVGPGTGSSAELAESVHEAEARFHELMELLGETPPPDSTRVAASVAALDSGLARVLEEIAAEETRGSR